MKKTKVYINGELPECCYKCDLYNSEWDYCMIGCRIKEEVSCSYYWNHRDKTCTLQSLKTHDRELVKEVCEKIKQYFNENLGNCEEYHCCGFNGKNIEDIYGFLEKLQKEYDK